MDASAADQLDRIAADLDDVQWALDCVQRRDAEQCDRCIGAAADGTLVDRAALLACSDRRP